MQQVTNPHDITPDRANKIHHHVTGVPKTGDEGLAHVKKLAVAVAQGHGVGGFGAAILTRHGLVTLDQPGQALALSEIGNMMVERWAEEAAPEMIEQSRDRTDAGTILEEIRRYQIVIRAHAQRIKEHHANAEAQMAMAARYLDKIDGLNSRIEDAVDKL